MNFNLIHITISVGTPDPSSLMFLLMNSGGRFSEACREGYCRWPARTCECCSRNCDCVWYSVFGQELSTDPDVIRRHQKPPLPFAFSFQPHVEACLLECRLVVIGRAIQTLEMLLQGFTEILAGLTGRVQGKIVAVATRSNQGDALPLGDGACISHPENLMVLSAADMLEKNDWGNRHVAIRVSSPLRIVMDGRPNRTFDFSLFLRSIIRRVSALSSYYGDCELDCDFRYLSILSENIDSVAKSFTYDHMPGGSRRLAGVVGEGHFSGKLDEVMPFLIIGTYVNVGKGASFGMGHYSLTTD